MDWICKEYFSTVFGFQEFTYGIGIVGFEEVPDCAAWLTIWAGGGVEHNVNCVCYVHVESGSVISPDIHFA